MRTKKILKETKKYIRKRQDKAHDAWEEAVAYPQLRFFGATSKPWNT